MKFWDGFEENAKLGTIHEFKDILDIYYNEKQYDPYTSEDIEKHRAKFLSMLEDLKNTYTDYKSSAKKLFTIFSFISGLNCMELSANSYFNAPQEEIFDRLVEPETGGSHLFLFTPDDGLFGLNTWLYGLLEGVHIIGLTSKPSGNYDDIIGGCPLEFSQHDLQHVLDLDESLGNTQKLSLTREIYYRVMSDNSLLRSQKEMVVLFFFREIHEQMTPFIDFSYKNGQVSYNRKRSINNFILISGNSIFKLSELTSFTPLIFSSEHVRNSRDELEKFGVIKKDQDDQFIRELTSGSKPPYSPEVMRLIGKSDFIQRTIQHIIETIDTNTSEVDLETSNYLFYVYVLDIIIKRYLY